MLFLLACFLMIASASADCDACLDQVCYTKTVIHPNTDLSGQIAIDWHSNILHYHFTTARRQKDITIAFDLDKIEVHCLDVEFSFARAVDHRTREVYIADQHETFKMRSSNYSNLMSLADLLDKNIWTMQYSGKLYFTEFQKDGLNIYQHGEIRGIKALESYRIDDFIVDKEDDIYFLSDSNVYVLNKGESEAKVFAGDVYSLSVDILGQAYMVSAATRGIYKIDYTTGNFTEIGAFASGWPYKCLFDRDNNIITYDFQIDAIYRLTPSKKHCAVSSEKTISLRNE